MRGWNAGQTKRPPGLNRRAFSTPESKWRVTRLGPSFGARSRGRHFRFRAAQPAHGVGANAPEDSDLRGLGLLGLAVLVLVLRANELAVNEDVVALVKRIGDGLAKAVESHDAVPLGFGLPLVVRVLPGLLCGDGKHGEVGAIAADLPLLRVFPEEADKLDVILPDAGISPSSAQENARRKRGWLTERAGIVAGESTTAQATKRSSDSTIISGLPLDDRAEA